jgi:hypothetical protein
MTPEVVVNENLGMERFYHWNQLGVVLTPDFMDDLSQYLSREDPRGWRPREPMRVYKELDFMVYSVIFRATVSSLPLHLSAHFALSEGIHEVVEDLASKTDKSSVAFKQMLAITDLVSARSAGHPEIDMDYDSAYSVSANLGDAILAGPKENTPDEHFIRFMHMVPPCLPFADIVFEKARRLRTFPRTDKYGLLLDHVFRPVWDYGQRRSLRMDVRAARGIINPRSRMSEVEGWYTDEWRFFPDDLKHSVAAIYYMRLMADAEMTGNKEEMRGCLEIAAHEAGTSIARGVCCPE